VIFVKHRLNRMHQTKIKSVNLFWYEVKVYAVMLLYRKVEGFSESRLSL
jgi:hypothetical protein